MAISDAALQDMSATIIKDVTAALEVPDYLDPFTGATTLDPTKEYRQEIGLELLEDQTPERTLKFYRPADEEAKNALSGQATVRAGATFVYFNDGYKDSYLFIIKDGKNLQNLKFEQQILSSPEVATMIDDLLTKK